MELFKHRNLALGCALFLVSLLISYYASFLVRIIVLITAVFLCVASVLWYFITKRKIALAVMLRAIPLLLFVFIAMVVSLIAFKDNEELSKYYDGESHDATLRITDVSFSSSSLGIYEAELLSIDEKEIDCKIQVRLSSGKLIRGDVLQVEGKFSQISSFDVGFDSRAYHLGNGIEGELLGQSHSVIGYDPIPILDFLDRANTFFENRFQKINDSKTQGVLSALFLGNKENLDLETRRDFTRIGLNHVLALSGMHITIVVTVIGYALLCAPIRKTCKELILIAATVFFVGMTGFSLSAMRAGLMVCLTYTLQFFGGRVGLISSLFISVTVICISSPYSIFSVSLILSFFAMLGCIVSSKIIKRYKLFRIFKGKIIRFVAFSLLSTLFAILFTLPIMSLFFGSLSIISPLSNIIIAPLFSFLIYLCPIYLALADVPILSVAIGSICKWVTKLSLFLGGALSRLDGILIPLTGWVQRAGVIVITAFLFILLTVKRKHLRRCLMGVGVGVLVFAIGSVILFAQRRSNIYVGAYSENGDIIFIEDKGELTLVDMTDASTSKYTLPYSLSEYLGYFEIDNYIMTSYSERSAPYFNNLSSSTVIKRVVLPKPTNDEEIKINAHICAIAASRDIDVSERGSTLSTESTTLTFSPIDSLPRSSVKCIAFCVDYEGKRFAYFGKSSYELFTTFTDEIAYTSDVAVFGTYGPKFKMNYKYEMSCVDYAVFLGDTISYADKSFLERLGKRTMPYNGLPLRFSLTP